MPCDPGDQVIPAQLPVRCMGSLSRNLPLTLPPLVRHSPVPSPFLGRHLEMSAQGFRTSSGSLYPSLKLDKLKEGAVRGLPLLQPF